MTSVDNKYIPPDIIMSHGIPRTIIQSNSEVTEDDKNLIINCPVSCVLRLPNPANIPGHSIALQNYSVNTVVSNVANVIPLNGGVPSVGILAGAVGKWAKLTSDGYNWITTRGN